MNICIIFLSCIVLSANAIDPNDVVFVILSQENAHHAQLANLLKHDINLQVEKLSKESPIIHLVHQDFPMVGAWTIFPLIPKLSNLHQHNTSWIFFIEDRTKVRVKLLLDILGKYNSLEEVWLGHALIDNEATIIHHFMLKEYPNDAIKYPNIASGFAISISLIQSLAERIILEKPSSDFSIDNSHELALFIWNKNTGVKLEDVPEFCIKEEPQCATFPVPFQPCDKLVPKEFIYFAVKTCEKFHNSRVPVVKSTWGKDAEIIGFFSDVEDKSIPTNAVNIPNTERGHCAKTLAILQNIAEVIQNKPEINWIILSDDDTILSVSKMQQLLTCYDSSTMIALGERYGYNVQNSRGYNYITGGGGMVFSRPLLYKLVQKDKCNCPAINTPDDMFLGICIDALGVSITHSPYFHQARPIDYAPGFLATRDAVSFHKHWLIDPVKVYNEWFDGDASIDVHSEL